MVSVSLKSLVGLSGSRPLWPAEFEAMIAAIEAKPADRTAMGAVADWLDEHGEPEYAGAWRWLMARERVVAYHQNANDTRSEWILRGLPANVLHAAVPDLDAKTLAGRVSQLADELAFARAEVEKQRAELD